MASQRSVTGPARTNNKDKWAHHSKWLLMGCRRQLVRCWLGTICEFFTNHSKLVQFVRELWRDLCTSSSRALP